jgi:cyclopropane fatty-acyl-phospholipid synthase-like methyltransferase
MQLKKCFIGSKKPEYYKGILIKADYGLHEQISQKIVSFLPRGSRILDMGAGEGALSQRLFDLNYSVVASDIDRDNFKCKNVDFYQVNFNVKFEMDAFIENYKESFDLVLGIEVIEHLENQWEYIRALNKLLKKKGFLILTTPNTTSWLSRLMFFKTGEFHQFQDADLSYGHIAPLSNRELKLILSSEGFNMVNIISAGTLPPLIYYSSLTGIIKNIAMLVLKVFMNGLKDGWCIMAIAQKE